MTKTENSFKRGYQQLRLCDVNTVRTAIYAILRINNRTSFAKYMNGERDIHPQARTEIESIFAQHGIDSVWG